jgi:hypothetical protein
VLMAVPDLSMREPLVLAIARDNVLIGVDLIDFLLTVPKPVQFTKRVIKDLRADGMDPFVLCRKDIVTWTQTDPEHRRVVR